MKLHEENRRMCCFFLLDIAVLEGCRKFEIVMLKGMSSYFQVYLGWHFTLASVAFVLHL